MNRISAVAKQIANEIPTDPTNTGSGSLTQFEKSIGDLSVSGADSVETINRPLSVAGKFPLGPCPSTVVHGRLYYSASKCLIQCPSS